LEILPEVGGPRSSARGALVFGIGILTILVNKIRIVLNGNTASYLLGVLAWVNVLLGQGFA
jgi:hypothetical protein